MRKLSIIILIVSAVVLIFLYRFNIYKENTRLSTVELIGSGYSSQIVSMRAEDKYLIHICDLAISSSINNPSPAYRLLAFSGIQTNNFATSSCRKKGISRLNQICSSCFESVYYKWLCPECEGNEKGYKYAILVKIDDNYFKYVFGSSGKALIERLNKDKVLKELRNR